MEKRQREAAEFLRKHGLEAKAETRLLDLLSELGELSKELLNPGAYGRESHGGGAGRLRVFSAVPFRGFGNQRGQGL